MSFTRHTKWSGSYSRVDNLCDTSRRIASMAPQVLTFFPPVPRIHIASNNPAIQDCTSLSKRPPFIQTAIAELNWHTYDQDLQRLGRAGDTIHPGRLSLYLQSPPKPQVFRDLPRSLGLTAKPQTTPRFARWAFGAADIAHHWVSKTLSILPGAPGALQGQRRVSPGGSKVIVAGRHECQS